MNKNYSEEPHILVIDDDDRIRTLTSRYLLEHGFIVCTAQNTKEARSLMKSLLFDALVVDIMMPEETGLEFVEDLRKTNNIPVILLTALGEIEDRVTGLEMGADDYLPKPFEPRELVLRLKAILRRTESKTPKEVKPFRMGKWRYDPQQNELQSVEGVLRLTTAEGVLLQALGSRKGDVVTRDDLAHLCEVDPDTRTIDVQVTRLRRKLEADSKAPRYLQTIRGKGYRLLIDEEI